MTAWFLLDLTGPQRNIVSHDPQRSRACGSDESVARQPGLDDEVDHFIHPQPPSNPSFVTIVVLLDDRTFPSVSVPKLRSEPCMGRGKTSTCPVPVSVGDWAYQLRRTTRRSETGCIHDPRDLQIRVSPITSLGKQAAPFCIWWSPSAPRDP